MAQDKKDVLAVKGGMQKLDARQKFEQGEKSLDLMKRRLYDSRKTETKLKTKLEEVAIRRKRLMADQYIERSKQYEVDLKKANEELQKADRKLADTITISSEISAMLAEKKETQRKLEIAYMDEGLGLCEEKLKKEKEGYYAAMEVAKVHQVESSKLKAEWGIFQRRKVEFEKI